MAFSQKNPQDNERPPSDELRVPYTALIPHWNCLSSYFTLFPLSQQLLHFDRLVQENDRLARVLSRVQDAASLEQAQLQVPYPSLLRLYLPPMVDIASLDLSQAVVAAARTRESELLRQVMKCDFVVFHSFADRSCF
jgi:hypothetical protein